MHGSDAQEISEQKGNPGKKQGTAPSHALWVQKRML